VLDPQRHCPLGEHIGLWSAEQFGQSDGDKHGPGDSPNDDTGGAESVVEAESDVAGVETAEEVIAADEPGAKEDPEPVSVAVKGPCGSRKEAFAVSVIIPPEKKESCSLSIDCIIAYAAAVSAVKLGMSRKISVMIVIVKDKSFELA
jgi:hypothetical protein